MSEANVAKQRTMLHVQVSGNPSPERLQQVAELFQKAAHDPNGAVLTTPDDVTLFSASLPADQALIPLQVVGTIGPEIIAQLTYEVNRAYCKGIGDNSFPNDWANAPEHQKQVNRMGVQNHLRNPNLTPQQSHQAWMRSKLDDGWVYGPVKDAEKKTHPAMVPYAGLPPEQKIKDFLFKAVVDTLRAQLPQPSPITRKVEVYIQETQQWVPADFMDLEPNHIWRFSDAQDQPYLAQTAVYVKYTDRGTDYTIDALPITFDVSQEQPNQPTEQSYDEVIKEHADEPSGEPAALDLERDITLAGRDPDFDGRSEEDCT